MKFLKISYMSSYKDFYNLAYVLITIYNNKLSYKIIK